MNDHERLRRLLGGEPLADLRRRLRVRYELGTENDSFTLTRLSAAARQALESLLGRRAKTADSMRVTQSELDAVLLRAGLAPDLRAALTALDGPIVDAVHCNWPATTRGERYSIVRKTCEYKRWLARPRAGP